MKIPKKIPKNTSSCDESNGVKFFSNIHSFSILCGHLKLNKKSVHTKVYEYNVKYVIHYINIKVVQKRVGEFI